MYHSSRLGDFTIPQPSIMTSVDITESAEIVGQDHPARRVRSTGSNQRSHIQLVKAEWDCMNARYILPSDDMGSNVPNSMFQGSPASAARMACDLTQQQSNEKNIGQRSQSSGETSSQELHTTVPQILEVAFLSRQGTSRPPLVSPPQEAWEARKDELRRLYLDDNMTLKSIMERMKQQGFKASTKMYKSRFTRWNFAKNKRRQNVAKTHHFQGSRLAVGKTTTFDRNGKPVARRNTNSGSDLCHEDTLDRALSALSASVLCPSPQSNILANITSISTLELQELLHIYCLGDYAPVPPLSPHSIYNVLSDLTTAHILFSQNENQLGGAFCERAFKSIHILATPTSKFDLFVFLVGNLVWANNDITRLALKYLSAYSATVPGSGVLLQQIFQGFHQYIQEHSFESYLAFVASQLTDILLKHNILNPDLVARGFLSLGAMPLFTAQFDDVVNKEHGKPKDNRRGHFTERMALQGLMERTFIEPERSPQCESTLTSPMTRAWNKLLESRLLNRLVTWEHEDVSRRATELMEISPSCGNLRPYFEGAASMVLAMFHRSSWDGKTARGDAQHELARLYLEKSVDASAKCDMPVNGTLLVKLVVLKKWQREAGCVEQAGATQRKAREWVWEQSLLMGCETVGGNGRNVL